MQQPDDCEIRSVVILKADRIYAECVRQLALRVFPTARVDISTSAAAAARLLANTPIDLFVTGVGVSIEGDVLELLSSYLRPPQAGRRVLAVSARREYRELVTLRDLGVGGVFDAATEPSKQLLVAMRAVASGARYWSATIVEHMQKSSLHPNPIARILTTFEQLVLSIIGDGSDDTAAAHNLGVSPATVSTVRRDLHRKLGVQHRGELVRVAAQHGFVRFTPEGVQRPGYSILSAAYRSRKNHHMERALHPVKSAPAGERRSKPSAIIAAL